MDLSLIYIFYTVHDYMYFEGLIHVYSESKKSLLYIAGKILPTGMLVHVLIDRPTKKDTTLQGLVSDINIREGIIFYFKLNI